jgi:polysaccharide pyruvyl transferase WcaK-like protein
MPSRIGVINPCGWGNLGDAAIVSATLDAIRARVPDAELFAITYNPDDTQRRHDVPAFRLSAPRYDRADSRRAALAAAEGNGDPGPRSLLAGARERTYRVRHFLANVRNELRHSGDAIRLARNSDLLIVAGGGQLDDFWGGAWAHPFNLFKWACAARLARTPIVMLSLGYGSDRSRLSRLFLCAAVRLSAYRSFRDPHTASIVRERLGVRDAAVVPDLALGLDIRQADPADGAGKLVVGVSPIAFADPRAWPMKDAAQYDRYLSVLAQFVDWLGGQGHRLILFCTDNMDVHSLRDLQGRCTSKVACLASDADRPEPYYKGVDELVTQLARADLVVASRLHGVILAHRLAKPVLAVSYDWKVDAHMAQVGEAENVLDIRALTATALIEGFQRLAGRRAETEQRLRRTAAAYTQQIEAQFDLVASRFLSGARAPKATRQCPW